MVAVTRTETMRSTDERVFDPQGQSMSDHREKTREKRLPKGYSGSGHLSWLFGGFSTVCVLCILAMERVQWWELAMVPLLFVMANAYEYVTHRFPGHHMWRPPLADFFKSHVGVHHKFFTYKHMFPTKGDDDLYFVLFPLSYYAIWLLMGTIPAFTIGRYFLTWNLQLLVVFVGSFYIMNYEVFHSFSHNALPRPLQRGLEKIPGMSFIRRNHRLHHHPRMMTSSNFNLTYPLFDWLCGTLVSDVRE